jgi:hypothetical protein
VEEDVRREEVDGDEGPPGTSRNYRGERSFIEGSDRWKPWPSFFHRLNLAGRRWTMLSGEYEDDIDTTLTDFPHPQAGTCGIICNCLYPSCGLKTTSCH